MSRVVGLWCMLVTLWAGCGTADAAIESSSGSGEETMRIMYVSLAGTDPLERARELVNTAQAAGFTAIQVLLADGVQFDHAPWKPAKGRARAAASATFPCTKYSKRARRNC